MRHLALTFTILTSLVSSVGSGADLCAQKTDAIGTKIDVTLALDNGKAQDRRFEVTGCKNGVFTASEGSQKTTILQFDAGQGEIKKVRFVGAATDQSQFRPVINALWNSKTKTVSFAAPGPKTCPPTEHWDDPMKMCMPGAAGPTAPTTPTPPKQSCPAGQSWDADMSMCMPSSSNGLMTMFHYNQFIVLTSGSGPRGRTAVSAPNMWMLMLDKKTSARNTVELSWMGTTDLWTVPKNGTPELFQTGDSNAAGTPFIDAQHPHSSPIMGLTFSDILSFGANGEKKLTFFFAPRGEATAGPEAFMHRASAEGNPDAPLGHHLQDVFHISSTVVGVKLDIGKWSLEGSTFSGHEASPSVVNLDMHKPDSIAVRANYQATENVKIGASYAKVHGASDERALAAWVQTTNALKGGTLSTTTLWGQNDNRTTAETLNSFLEEFLFQLGKNDFYGRFEAVQRTPNQLEVQLTDGKTGAKWVKAYTLGYERQIESRGDLKVYTGVAATSYSVPRDFRLAYGSRPMSAKVYLRIKFGKPMTH